MTNPDELREIALRAAQAGAVELIARAGRPWSGVQHKSSAVDLVSDADHAAEAAITDVLDRARPHDGRIAEEGGERTGTSGVWWVIDPLDGTTNYLWGLPHWAVSVAACDEQGPIVGVVIDPSRNETYVAVRGGGAWCGTTHLRIGDPPPVSEALVGTGFNYSSAERAHQAQVLMQVLPHVRDIRRMGAAAIDLAWVATGRLNAFLERGLHVWDWAAAQIIVTEAGGVVRELTPTDDRPGGIVAAHPALVDPVCALFGEDASASR
jgi:myo-inositol-1(or 4)-monophosphatase